MLHTSLGVVNDSGSTQRLVITAMQTSLPWYVSQWDLVTGLQTANEWTTDTVGHNKNIKINYFCTSIKIGSAYSLPYGSTE